jgi:hypothetical protein
MNTVRDHDGWLEPETLYIERRNVASREIEKGGGHDEH